jgi:dolichol-phosphate mannosyltransferase
VPRPGPPPAALGDEDRKRITVVIPTKNEAQNLPFVAERVLPYCGELLVVDGHSTDGTREVAASHGATVLLDDGRGKGAALRVAAARATREVVVFIDADGSHDPDDIPAMVLPILRGEQDLVIGSRMRGGSDELHSSFFEFIRLVGSEIITLIINYRFGRDLTDYQNGFRAIRRDVMYALGTTENIFTIEQEMSIKAIRAGYRVGEVPAHEYRRRSGESHIVVWRVGLRYLWCLIKNLV